MRFPPLTLTIDRLRALAVLVIFMTPILMPLMIAWRHGAACAQRGDESVALLIPLALLLASTNNPWRAVAACLAYFPVGYALSVEPCLPPQSQGSGGLLYILWPVLVAWVGLGALIGGAILNRVFPAARPTELPDALPRTDQMI